MSLDSHDELILTHAIAEKAVEWWGSDCDACGNTTPDSMRCEMCGSVKWTRHLYVVGERKCDPK